MLQMTIYAAFFIALCDVTHAPFLRAHLLTAHTGAHTKRTARTHTHIISIAWTWVQVMCYCFFVYLYILLFFFFFLVNDLELLALDLFFVVGFFFLFLVIRLFPAWGQCACAHVPVQHSGLWFGVTAILCQSAMFPWLGKVFMTMTTAL